MAEPGDLPLSLAVSRRYEALRTFDQTGRANPHFHLRILVS
jgi:hypothetical protein